MKRVLADPFDLFGDGPASTWSVPAIPADSNDKARLERDVKSAIAELSEKLNPVSLVDIKPFLKALAYATRHRDDDKDAWNFRSKVYHAALQDVPIDMWPQLTKQAILTFTWWPSVAELNKLVRPYVEQRQRMLGRARQILDKHREGNKTSDKPVVVETEEERLAASIVSLRKYGKHDRAAAAERRLAAIQQRDVAEWALAIVPPSAAPKERERGEPAPQPLGKAAQAALNRSLAKSHREQGRTGYAEKLEREADELAPLDIDEPIAEHAAHG